MDDVTRAAELGIPGSDLGWSLGVILRRWHEQVEEAVAGIPHGTRGYQILSVVGHNIPPTQSGLAKHLGIDKTVMPYIIDALEKERLVERQTDVADRRVRRIVITPTGARTLRRLEERVHAAENLVFENVPAGIREAFTDHAARLATSIHAVDPDVDACGAVLDALTGSTLR